ncbi:hypothetical protein BDV33DRAFT_172422 [Aspergillus novoparasiticus]|uniref:Uncharacterized protein n=1 Tax=Aspergillus novoparasiticus TaxID=986946 RepID=A0A5N6ERT8_9EURO|nr:hypothetical protein BDV33DRAFT_172422 [Aspergillus novoparasiticus]
MKIITCAFIFMLFALILGTSTDLNLSPNLLTTLRSTVHTQQPNKLVTQQPILNLAPASLFFIRLCTNMMIDDYFFFSCWLKLEHVMH